MTATYDSGTSEIRLTGDGLGWQRCVKALPSPPSGTNQVTYILRFWIADGDTITTEQFTGWDPYWYLGFKFDANHISKPDLSVAGEEVDLFGLWPRGESSYVDTDRYATLNHSGGYCFPGTVFVGANDDMIMYHGTGNGSGASVGFTDSVKVTLDPTRVTAYPETAAKGATYTAIWQCTGSEVSESVDYIGFVDETSIDLDSLDLSTIDTEDLTNSFTPVNGQQQVEINGAAETGTNWRPSAGVMGFPTHFMARYPYSIGQLTIDYVAVRYDTITA